MILPLPQIIELNKVVRCSDCMISEQWFRSWHSFINGGKKGAFLFEYDRIFLIRVYRPYTWASRQLGFDG